MIKISKKNIIYNDTLIDSMFIAHFGWNVDHACKMLREFDKYMGCFKKFNDIVGDRNYSIYVAVNRLSQDQQTALSMKCADPIKFVTRRTLSNFHDDNRDVNCEVHTISDMVKYIYISKEYFYITNKIGNDMIVRIEN